MECTGVSPIIQWCLVRNSASSGIAEIARKAVVLRNTHNNEFDLRVWIFAIAVETQIVVLRNHSKVLVGRLWYEGQLWLLLQRPGPATERWRAVLKDAQRQRGRFGLAVSRANKTASHSMWNQRMKGWEEATMTQLFLESTGSAFGPAHFRLTFVITKGCWDPPELWVNVFSHFIVIDPLSY